MRARLHGLLLASLLPQLDAHYLTVPFTTHNHPQPHHTQTVEEQPPPTPRLHPRVLLSSLLVDAALHRLAIPSAPSPHRLMLTPADLSDSSNTVGNADADGDDDGDGATATAASTAAATGTTTADADANTLLGHAHSAAAGYDRTLLAALRAVARPPDAATTLVLLCIAGHVCQVVLGPALTAAGGRVASRVRAGEWHRLVTALFLHANWVHLAVTCVFGLSRLAPVVAALFGGTHLLLIFVASGVCGNLFALQLDEAVAAAAGGAGGVGGMGGGWAAVPSVGASGALFGLDGALLAYGLRNDGLSRATLSRSLQRVLLTVCMSATRYGGGHRAWRVDHAAHVGGYVGGAAVGWLLAPRLSEAVAVFREAITEEMCENVGSLCGGSGAAAEAAMLRYLRHVPTAERPQTLRAWRLEQLDDDAEAPPHTEDWPAVFKQLKQIVQQRAVEYGASYEPPPSHDAPQALDEQRLRLRRKAEAAVLHHFAHRARVALPSLRLLHARAISLRELRRRRLSVGAVAPPALSEAISGLVLLAVALGWHDAVSLATRSLQRRAPF